MSVKYLQFVENSAVKTIYTSAFELFECRFKKSALLL